MKTLAVVGTITQTNPIEGADRIHQAIVDCGEEGVWSGVVAKDMGVGDRVIALLQDALLPESDRWDFMSKHKWRVRMARFKGVPSECVIVRADVVEQAFEDGRDVTDALGIKKYEKPVPAGIAGDVRGNFPDFIPKTDEENFQRIRNLQELMEGSDWVITAKYDGTSCTVWNDEEGMHVCSRNYELKEFTESGKSNVYWQAARRFGLEHLPCGYALQFEVYGPGIQGNPHKAEELSIAAFTLYNVVQRRRAHFGALVAVCDALAIPMVNVLGAGTGPLPSEKIREVADSVEVPDGGPSEGVVIRDINNKFSFKAINLGYGR